MCATGTGGTCGTSESLLFNVVLESVDERRPVSERSPECDRDMLAASSKVSWAKELNVSKKPLLPCSSHASTYIFVVRAPGLGP